MTDQKVEFFANKGKWIVVKKLKVTEKTGDLDVARFLASVNETMDRKLYDFLGSAMDLKALDTIAAECCGAEKGKKGYVIKGRISNEKMQAAIAATRSVKVSKAINEVVEGKKTRDAAKSYVMRRVFDFMSFPINVSSKQVEGIIEEHEQLA